MRLVNARAGIYAGLLALCLPAVAWGGPCDEYNPRSPARGTRITLSPGDFIDESRDEMRSFVATGSLGAVEAYIITASPPGIAGGLFAVPQLSRFSTEYGEEIKGIALGVRLADGARAGRVVVGLRQVCARYFHNTFLYY